jgi:hypothetical protein
VKLAASIAQRDAPSEPDGGGVDGLVVLVAASGQEADTAPARIRTRAHGWDVDLTIDRSVTLYGVGEMAAVELRGPRGERYISYPFPVILFGGDRVLVTPAW